MNQRPAHTDREIRITRPNQRRGPFPEPVAAAVVDIVAEVVAVRTATAGAEVGWAVVVERTAVVSD